MKKLVAALAIALILGFGLFFVVLAGSAGGSVASQGLNCTFTLPSSSSGNASPNVNPNSSATPESSMGSASQRQNLETIVGQVKAKGLPEQAAVIAVATALAESGMENINYGPDGSLGLFQQIAAEGWGTAEQIMDPTYATDAFLAALEKVPNWQSLALQNAAQAVQRSANPWRYAQFAAQAEQWVQSVWGQITSVALAGGSSAISNLCAVEQGLVKAAGGVAGSIINAASQALAGLWPVVSPIPNPGWEEKLPGGPNWPASVAAHPPTAVSNQCVAGAEWAYDTFHMNDPGWQPYVFPSGNGVDVARNAAENGLQASSVPVVGDVVSFTVQGDSAGHVALVIATASDRFEVVEQNWVTPLPPFENAWNPAGWDIRSLPWPNATVVGFAGPPGSPQ